MKYIYYELRDRIREQKSSFNPILMPLLPRLISCLLYRLAYTPIYYFNHPKLIVLLKSTFPTQPPNLQNQPNNPNLPCPMKNPPCGLLSHGRRRRIHLRKNMSICEQTPCSHILAKIRMTHAAPNS